MALFGRSGAEDAALAARYKHLLNVAKTLSSERDLKKVLTATLDTIVELSGAERGFVWLGGPNEGSVAVARNLDREHVRKPAGKLSRSIIGKVMESGETLLTDNASEDFLGSASIGDLKLRSVLCTPLILRGATIGAIYVDHRFREAEFSEEDTALLDQFRDLAAIAIENARLFEENEAQRRRLEELNARLEQEVAAQNEEMEAYRRRLRTTKPRDEYRFDYSQIIGYSPAIREIFSILDRIIPTSFPVLVQGESGTGKELIARAIHYNGPRSQKPFLTENCSAVPESLLESELFGHVRGSFTGADRTRDGLFQGAHKGTLFLDEIGEMSPALQVKLLRALQDGEIRRVGSDRSIRVDVRIIAATNVDLSEAVKAGRFREDLFYRLNVLPVPVPALRDRREDIPDLVTHFLTSISVPGKGPFTITERALDALTRYGWPGNVRELKNTVERMKILAEGLVVDLNDVPREVLGADSPGEIGGTDPEVPLADVERRHILNVLRHTEGNKSRAARILGISLRTLYNKLSEYEKAGAVPPDLSR